MKYIWPSSSGEQRGMTARPWPPTPKVLLCDEATSALIPHHLNPFLAFKKINWEMGITVMSQSANGRNRSNLRQGGTIDYSHRGG